MSLWAAWRRLRNPHSLAVCFVAVGIACGPLTHAIGTATKSAAALLALDDRGVIEPGKLADLLIVDGDPSKHIADIDRIASVWHRGKQPADSITTFTP